MMDYAKSRIGVVSFLGIFINHGGGPESLWEGVMPYLCIEHNQQVLSSASKLI